MGTYLIDSDAAVGRVLLISDEWQLEGDVVRPIANHHALRLAEVARVYRACNRGHARSLQVEMSGQVILFEELKALIVRSGQII